MEFGLDYYRDDVAGHDAANYFIPYAHLRFDLGGGGFVPYVELDGTLKHNDMRELMETNLYYVPRYTDPMPRNTVDYSVRVGVSGRLVEDKLIYRLFVGYSFIENHNFWYCYTPTTRYEGFSLVQGRLNVMSLNGELEFRPVSNFTFSIGGRGLTYTEHQTLSIGLPEFEGTIRARYHHRKFSVGLVFDLQSNRYISRVIPWFPNDGIVGNMRIPYTVDLVECRLVRVQAGNGIRRRSQSLQPPDLRLEYVSAVQRRIYGRCEVEFLADRPDMKNGR